MPLTVHMRGHRPEYVLCGLESDRVDAQVYGIEEVNCPKCLTKHAEEAALQQARVENAKDKPREFWHNAKSKDTLPPHTHQVLLCWMQPWAREYSDAPRMQSGSRDGEGEGWHQGGAHHRLDGNGPTHWREMPEPPLAEPTSQPQ